MGDLFHFEHLRGFFEEASDEYTRDMALHAIFAHILANKYEFPMYDVACNLFRLYFDGWDGARTYFYLVTGVLIDDTVDVDRENYRLEISLNSTRHKVELSSDTMNTACMNLDTPLSDLFFTEEDEDATDVEDIGEEDEDDDDDDDLDGFIVSDNEPIEEYEEEEDDDDDDEEEGVFTQLTT